MITPIRILIQPGLNNSGPGHWQSLWQQLHQEFERVQQTNWDQPRLADWLATLRQTLAKDPTPTLIVAHSLGSIASAHLAASDCPANLAGILLVAPADVERTDAPAEVRNFAPLPLAPLPVPSIVVASDNDPYCQWARSEQLAQAWGSELVRLNAAGHINADSGFGEWKVGLTLLQRLLDRVVATS
jgi:predicted alpha/beta hydrolase family esterase